MMKPSRGTGTKTARLDAFRKAVAGGHIDQLISEAYEAVIEAAGAELDLTTEIGGLRLLLYRAIAFDALEGDAYETGELVAELVGSITAAMRSQRRLVGTATDDLAAAVDKVLADLGLGEDDAGE